MSHLVIPLAVLYAGLAGTVLALIMATIQNKWSLKVFFLLALRLAIGWHFLFEGLNKIHSHSVGPAEMNRPFSSEPYFKEADGPLGSLMRKQIGDPEELLKAKTTPTNVDGFKIKVENPNAQHKQGVAGVPDEVFVKLVPEAIRKDWDEFSKAFAEKYTLTDREKNRFDGVIDEEEKKELATKTGPGDLTFAAMAKFGKWVVGAEARDSKVKFVSGDVPLTIPQRLDYLNERKADLAELEKREAEKLGNGAGYEMAQRKDAKALVSATRATLIADVDAFLQDQKKAAFDVVMKARFEKEAPAPSVVVGKDDVLLAGLLPPAKTPDVTTFDALPAPLKLIWDKYHAAFDGFYPSTDATTEAYDLIKIRFANWYFDKDEFTGEVKKDPFTREPKKEFGKLTADYLAKQQKAQANPTNEAVEEAAKARAAVLGALDGKYNGLRDVLTATIPPDVQKRVFDPEKKSPVESIDWRTRWMLTAVGAMLLMGLFTRLACVVGGVFLVLTYLTHPPFPWLPLPPGTEGNPVFVNKNAIEFLAMMVILVHPTGRWMGIDSLIHRLIFGAAKEPKTIPDTMAKQAAEPTAKKIPGRFPTG